MGKYNPSGLENSKLNELGNPTISTNKILSIAKGAIFTGNPNPSIWYGSLRISPTVFGV